MSSLQSPLPARELPDWMRRAQRGVDWGFLLVVVLCVIVSSSFLIRTELPHTNATENYVYRTNDYSESIAEGWLYPRWSANVLGGYGAPIPSFYPPVPAYVPAILQILLTNNAVSAVRLLYVLASCVAGVSVYVLVMRQSGAAAGILAATLYVYSPYINLVVPHVLGNLPTMIVLALAPALLWATDRLISAHQSQNLLLVTLFTAGLLLTSPKQAVVVYALALVYSLWRFRQIRKTNKFIQFMLAIGLGILLAGFYWIPALLEQSAIHWQPNIAGEPLTLRLSEIIAPIRALDPAEMKPHAQLTIGVVTIIFAIAGGIVHIFLNKRFGFGLLFLTIGFVITTIALILLPHETWLLGTIILCYSMAGSDVLLLRTKLSIRRQRLILPVLMVGIWIGSRASWFPPQPTETFGSANGAAQVNYEQQGYGIAVLQAGESIPSTLTDNTVFSRNLIDGYKSGDINKLAPRQATNSFQASPLSHFTHGDRFQLRRVDSSLTLNYLTAYFPGWRATIGEQQVNLRRDEATGLIQVDLPVVKRSNSELLIVLGSTNVRLGSWLISGLVLLIIMVLTWGKFRTLRKNPLEDLDLLRLEEARLIALPIGCFGLVALLVLVPNPFFKFNPQNGAGLSNSFSTQMRSNTGLTLSAFKLTNNIYSAEDTFDITLFWQTQRFLNENYQVKLFLENNSDESRWNETELRNPGYYPTRRWNTSQYQSDEYEFPLAENIPAGNYQIHVQVYDCSTSCDNNTRLEFFNPNGQQLGADVILPTLITISR